MKKKLKSWSSVSVDIYHASIYSGQMNESLFKDVMTTCLISRVSLLLESCHPWNNVLFQDTFALKIWFAIINLHEKSQTKEVRKSDADGFPPWRAIRSGRPQNQAINASQNELRGEKRYGIESWRKKGSEDAITRTLFDRLNRQADEVNEKTDNH